MKRIVFGVWEFFLYLIHLIIFIILYKETKHIYWLLKWQVSMRFSRECDIILCVLYWFVTGFLLADNRASVKTDSTSCSELRRISLGAHNVQMLYRLGTALGPRKTGFSFCKRLHTKHLKSSKQKHSFLAIESAVKHYKLNDVNLSL